MAIVFTVAICTYNGAKRLPAVLERLKTQCTPQHIHWEVLVIDNNSIDNTSQIVQAYQADWPSAYPLHYCFEPQQGLAFARHRAIQEARGQFVGFLDDDNLPAPNWVEAAYTFGQAHLAVGAYGSRIIGEFEVSPPANFDRIAGFLALTDRGSEPLPYEPHKKVLPPGAGLVVRRQAWLDTVPEHLVLQGRVGNSMLASEDLEAVLYLQRAGWEIWYNPEMQVAHLIPSQRLERKYLLKLFRGIGLSRYQTRILSLKAWQRPLVYPLYLLNDVRKIIRHLLKYGFTVKRDLVAACEMELFIASLLSPFFFCKQDFERWLSKYSTR